MFLFWRIRPKFPIPLKEKCLLNDLLNLICVGRILKTKKQKKQLSEILNINCQSRILLLFQNKRVGEVIHIWTPAMTPTTEKVSLHKDGNSLAAHPGLQFSRPQQFLCLRSPV